MDVLDRVFGSCFRSWAVKENVGESKYIDYLPTRKWKYSDHNLMRDLSETNPSDVLDLSDDPRGQTSSNMKLRLHDNIFPNPLNENTSQETVNESTESEEIIMEHAPQINTEENNNSIGVVGEDRKNSQETLIQRDSEEPETELENKDTSIVVNEECSSEEDDSERKLSQEALIPDNDSKTENNTKDKEVSKIEEAVDEQERKLSQETLLPDNDVDSETSDNVSEEQPMVVSVGTSSDENDNSSDNTTNEFPSIKNNENCNEVETVTSTDICVETVTSTDVCEETVTSTDVCEETVTSTDICEETVTSTDVCEETVTSTDVCEETDEVAEQILTNGHYHSGDETRVGENVREISGETKISEDEKEESDSQNEELSTKCINEQKVNVPDETAPLPHSLQDD